MNTCFVTGVDHLLQLLFVRHPVRPEHTRHTRHTQNISIRLQQLVLAKTHRIAISAELIAIIALEGIVTVDERNGIAGLTCSRQTCTFQFPVVICRNTVIECRIFGREIKGSSIPTCIIQTVLQCVHIAVPILHDAEIRLSRFVIFIDMAVMITLAVVIAEAIYFDHIAHPFQVCFEHIAHVLIRVIPVARSSIIRLVAITVIVSSCREAHTLCRSTRCRIIHLVRPADIRSVRYKLTVRSEVITACVTTPAALRIAVIDHNISYHSTAVLMNNFNHLRQFFLRTTVAAQGTVVRRVITQSASGTHRREPDHIKPLTDLLCRRTVVAVQEINPFGTTKTVSATYTRFSFRAVPIERLQHHIRTFSRNRTAVTRIRLLAFADVLSCLAIRSRTDIQLVSLVLQFDIEIITSAYTHIVMVAVARKTGY